MNCLFSAYGLHLRLGAKLLNPLPDAESVPVRRDRFAYDDRAGNRQQTRLDEPEFPVEDRQQAPPVQPQAHRDHGNIRRRQKTVQTGPECVRDAVRRYRAFREDADRAAAIQNVVGLFDQQAHFSAVDPTRHFQRAAPSEKHVQAGKAVKRLIHHKRHAARFQAQDKNEVKERNMVCDQQDRAGIRVVFDPVDTDPVQGMRQDQPKRPQSQRRPPDQQSDQPNRQQKFQRMYAPHAAPRRAGRQRLRQDQQKRRTREHGLPRAHAETRPEGSRQHLRTDPKIHPESAACQSQRDAAFRFAACQSPVQSQNRKQQSGCHHTDQHAVVAGAQHGAESRRDRKSGEPYAPGWQGGIRNGIQDKKTGADKQDTGNPRNNGRDQEFKIFLHGDRDGQTLCCFGYFGLADDRIMIIYLRVCFFTSFFREQIRQFLPGKRNSRPPLKKSVIS